MADGLEFLEGLSADALGGRVGGDQRGKLLFELEQFVIEAVVFLVGNFGLGQHVIGMIVAVDFIRQLGVPGAGLLKRHAGSVQRGNGVANRQKKSRKKFRKRSSLLFTRDIRLLVSAPATPENK